MTDLHCCADAISSERLRRTAGLDPNAGVWAKRASSGMDGWPVADIGTLDPWSPRSRADEARIAELEDALQARTLLLQEVDHRVKNSLMMISALLRLEARAIASPLLSGKLETMLERVDAVATVHRRFSRTNDLRWFDVCAFAEDLARDVITVSGRMDIRLITKAAPVMIEASKASAIGVVINEVVTNAVKHAFAGGRSGVLSIIARSEGRRGQIEIWDDGPGLSGAELNGSGSGRPAGLGNLLIERLCRQAEAEVSWSVVGPGTGVTLSFATAI